MKKLNFPSYNFRLKNSENKTHIFDEIRKKFVLLQPEEWVRQHCLNFLIQEKKYPASLINVEKQIKLNELSKRYDIVIYNNDGSVHCIVECKAPNVNINQNTFDQIARYNTVLKSDYLMLTNGLNHFFCKMDFEKQKYYFLTDLPVFNSNK